MNKLSKKYLKYMANNHKTSYSFSDFQELTPDTDQDEIIEALRFLKSHGYIIYKSYDNLPAIIRLISADNPQNHIYNPGAEHNSSKKFFNKVWIFIVGAATIIGTVFTMFTYFNK